MSITLITPVKAAVVLHFSQEASLVLQTSLRQRNHANPLETDR